MIENTFHNNPDNADWIERLMLAQGHDTLYDSGVILPHSSIDWLIERTIDGLIERLTEWLNDWLIEWLNIWMIDWMIERLID